MDVRRQFRPHLKHLLMLSGQTLGISKAEQKTGAVPRGEQSSAEGAGFVSAACGFALWLF